MLDGLRDLEGYVFEGRGRSAPVATLPALDGLLELPDKELVNDGGMRPLVVLPEAARGRASHAEAPIRLGLRARVQLVLQLPEDVHQELMGVVLEVRSEPLLDEPVEERGLQLFILLLES